MVSAAEEREALLKALESVPPEALPNLRRIVELFRDTVLQEQERRELEEELRDEMQAWDAASDEALIEFEKSLEDPT